MGWLLIVLGIVVALGGGMVVFAAGMSDAPEEAKVQGNRGCFGVFCGCLAFIIGVAMLFIG